MNFYEMVNEVGKVLKHSGYNEKVKQKNELER